MSDLAAQMAKMERLLEKIPAEHRGALFERVLKGFHPQENTRMLELAFATVWAEKNLAGGGYLPTLLLTDEDNPRRGCVPQNDREWQIAYLVAATLIQWLPTSVGTSFLREAFKRGGGDFNYTLPQTTN